MNINEYKYEYKICSSVMLMHCTYAHGTYGKEYYVNIILIIIKIL